MQNNRFKAFITAVFLTVFTFGFAASDKEASSEDKPFDTKELIFHHIKDSHGFHVAGDVSVPLPVILWTDNGLVTFMSSAFHHDIEGEVIVERKGLKFVNVHEKIYQLDSGASTVSFDAESHPTNASRPLDLSITKNVFSMLLSMVVIFLIFLTAARSYRKSTDNVPTGIGKFLEPIIVFIRDEVAIPNIGEHKYHKYMPFLLTLFFFIWINNIFGLIPFFPFSSNLSGNIAFTATLAVFTFIITLFSSKKYYWKHMLWMPGLPIPMKLFLAPIEIIGMFVKPIALLIRLFANITAGHVIVLSLISLIFILNTEWAALVSVPFTVFISVIEVLVVAIQAYIFTMLSALYFGQALEAEHDH
ncbi:F0F1 ATP synthase subunit A [Poritiphilus flavus]|uniref:ATP synthase subunit a n=1 Tax=Poritiphilus flavus TaxID=2697053 RepID=A0A6L9E8C0_9FLAO|nr:F0F1 ATP synthase subunit A [Poritiphilus flavus]NAS10940.1 F0F1 ATP synthase subunit A [Poritiphilus flavus]